MDLDTLPLHDLHADGGDPHEAARKLRAAGPLVPVRLPGGVAAWLVTHQETGRSVLSDGRFVKDIRFWAAWQRGEIPPSWPLAPLVTIANMSTATGPDHRRLRAPLARAFTAHRVERLRPRIAELAAELLTSLTDLTAASDQPVDLRAHFAHPLPLRVICELFGVPDADRPRLRYLCGALFATAASPEETLAVHRELRAALAALIAQRRTHPADDLTTALTTEGDDLTDAELVDTLLLMIVAGHETTVGLLVNAVRALLSHPDQLALLTDGRLPWSSAVEETLRWDPPVGTFPFRYARCDIPLAGHTIRTGDPVLLAYTAFGRDPHQHGPDADHFDLTRTTPTRHLTFAHGIHHCLGAPLARLEAETALPALFTHFPHLALHTPDSPRLPSLIVNTFRKLLVRVESQQTLR